MKRYVIVHRDSGLIVKCRYGNELYYTSSFMESMLFNSITYIYEFADKYVRFEYDIYEIVLKKV